MKPVQLVFLLSLCSLCSSLRNHLGLQRAQRKSVFGSLTCAYLPCSSRSLTTHRSLPGSGDLAQQQQQQGSAGVETLISFLNSAEGKYLSSKLVLADESLNDEMESANFWMGGNMEVVSFTCTGIVVEGIRFKTDCKLKGKQVQREALVPFSISSNKHNNNKVSDETALKLCVLEMCQRYSGRSEDAAAIAKLGFGHDCSMPVDFRWNQVPHQGWVRAYLYDSITTAVVRAIQDPTVPNKSRMRLRVNIPEVNPAFDTYRIGTLLEIVRDITLALAEPNLSEQEGEGNRGGKRVRICVQQSLGEGIFVGTPLALSALRPVLERMDWGDRLTEEQKFQRGDGEIPRKEALVRLGRVGPDEIKEDDDVLIVIAPQNIIGGEIILLLDEMCKKAAGRPVLLINPLLADKPSSNNRMQIRGRKERREIEDSFMDIYGLRLLYPSNGGYMFPIRGMIGKKDWRAPWVAYSKGINTSGQETYEIVGAWKPDLPPDPNDVSNAFSNAN